FGVLGLRLGGVIPPEAAAGAVRAWWIGDLTGDLLFAPVLMTWIAAYRDRDRTRRRSRWRDAEAIALGAIVVVVALRVFSARPGSIGNDAWPYMVFPPAVAAALRF